MIRWTARSVKRQRAAGSRMRVVLFSAHGGRHSRVLPSPFPEPLSSCGRTACVGVPAVHAGRRLTDSGGGEAPRSVVQGAGPFWSVRSRYRWPGLRDALVRKASRGVP